MEKEEISSIVDTAVSSISKIAEVNTVVGKPLVTMDGTTILPVSQVAFAFMAGGGEYGNKKVKRSDEQNFAGGSGGGASLTPIGFLVVNKDGVKLVNTDQQSTIEKLFDVAKDVVKTFKN